MYQQCKKCGAEYDLSETHVPMRDKDSLECVICGRTLISWNGSKIYDINRIIYDPTKDGKKTE